MLGKFYTYTKKTLKFGIICLIIKSLHDYDNNKDYYFYKKFNNSFMNGLEILDKSHFNKFYFMPFYQNILRLIKGRSQEIPFSKKTLDIESFEINLNKINLGIDNNKSLMNNNINLQRSKIQENINNLSNFESKINEILEKTKKEHEIVAKKLEDSENHCVNLSKAIEQINKKMEKEFEILNALMANTDFFYFSHLDNKLKEIGKEFSSKLKELGINSDSDEENKKIALIEKLEELTNLRSKYLKEKLNLIEKEQIEYQKFFFNKLAHLDSLVQDFKSLSNQYKYSLLNNMTIKNELYSYDILINSNIQEDIKTLGEEKLKKLSNEISESLNDQISIPLINQLKKLIHEEKKVFNIKNLDLRLHEDQDFIRKISLAHYIRHVFVINTALSLIDLKSKENNNRDLININCRDLKEFSKSINDNYCSKLLNKDFNLISNVEIKSEFKKIKKRMLFDMFNHTQSFSNFLIARFMEFSSFIWFPIFFRLEMNLLSPNDNEMIRTLKYLSHLQHHINNENYKDAYQYLRNLNNKITYFDSIENLFRERVRAIFIVDDLNSHLKSI